MDNSQAQSEPPKDNPPPTPHPETSMPHDDEYARSKRSKFRFKTSSSSKSRSKHRSHRDHDRDRDRDPDPNNEDPRHRSHRHHHRRHKSSTRKRPRSASPDDPLLNAYTSIPNLSNEDAFRESLFDALGDDEGASYWESVYGQPIHNYAVPSVPTGPNGELEQMDDEEYAAYVRARMWERTREGMIEEQERLRQERARQKRREEARAEHQARRGRFEMDMEECLARGRERKRRRAWKGIWGEYLASWVEVDRAAAAAAAAASSGGGDGGDGGAGGEGSRLRNILFWPVESGKRRDVSREAVEEFMRHAPVDEDDNGATSLLGMLKAERVRWHPDKIQHRYGVLGIDEAVMRSVTEVFQIVDQMWSKEREKQA